MTYNRDLFTLEEQNYIQRALDTGIYDHLSVCIYNLDPQKEKELQNILDSVRNDSTGFDSEVQKKYRGVLIESPEQEAQIQRELTAEFQAWKDKKVKKQVVNDVKEEKQETTDVSEVVVQKKRTGRPPKKQVEETIA